MMYAQDYDEQFMPGLFLGPAVSRHRGYGRRSSSRGYAKNRGITLCPSLQAQLWLPGLVLLAR